MYVQQAYTQRSEHAVECGAAAARYCSFYVAWPEQASLGVPATLEALQAAAVHNGQRCPADAAIPGASGQHHSPLCALQNPHKELTISS